MSVHTPMVGLKTRFKLFNFEAGTQGIQEGSS
jgi:hypothetical protein